MYGTFLLPQHLSLLRHLPKRARNVKHEHDRSSIFIQRLLSERSEQKADTPALAEPLEAS